MLAVQDVTPPTSRMKSSHDTSRYQKSVLASILALVSRLTTWATIYGEMQPIMESTLRQ